VIKVDFEIHDQPQPSEWLVARINRDYITITRKRQPDGSDKFAVYNEMRCCLAKDGSRFDYESLPSSRPDDWTDTHRFDTFEEAVAAALPVARQLLEETEERVRLLNERRS